MKDTAQQKSGFDKAFEALTVWSRALADYPGFTEWKRESIAIVMSHGDPLPDQSESDFSFPEQMAAQHEAITAFLHLHTTWQAIADTEFYFRRYPFRGLPVGMDTHLRYICEMYFSRIYEFSERLKKSLNAINDVVATGINVGGLVKHFTKEFREEIKARNQIHHHSRFEERTIDRIALEGLMAEADPPNRDRGWRTEQRLTYRKASQAWANRAKRRSEVVKQYVDAVGELMVRECTFLTEPTFLNGHVPKQQETD